MLAAAALGAQAAELTVSAASSLGTVFRVLAPAFEGLNPGIRLALNFGASDALLAQIARGAPVDIFASADEETLDRADRQKLLVPGSRQIFARNSLVLITPADSTLRLSSLADLQQPQVKRIAVGSPTGVPAGRYARGALEDAKLWAAIEPRAIFAQNVRQALDYVARGEVDAGFVYATDAAMMKSKVRIAFVVPAQTPIVYPIATVAGSRNAGSAQRFVEFVLSPPAQAVLAQHGFGKP